MTLTAETAAIVRRIEDAFRVAAPSFPIDPVLLGDLAGFRIYTSADKGVGRIRGDNLLLIHESVVMPEKAVVDLSGPGNLVVVGPDVRLGGAFFRCTGHDGVIVIGRNAGFTKTCAIQTRYRDNVILIGANTTWESGEMLAIEDGQGVVIGETCMFSSDISMRTSDSHPIYDIASGDRLNLPGWIRVGDNCWLGRGARISKGVTLAPRTIIGQASIVTKDTKSDAVYAGVPARLIRSNVRWDRRLPRAARPPAVAAES